MKSEKPAPVADEEMLARFLLFRGWFVSGTGRVKPDAFIPHPHAELSVTRHADLDEQELWEIGETVAATRKLVLHARADLQTGAVREQGLEVVPAEPPPHHANITGWARGNKPAQKIVAQELAARAALRMRP